MGRVIRREVVAIRCEVATPRRGTPQCDQVADVWPVSVDTVWQEQILDLSKLVDAGWGIVLTARIRTYCPEHSQRVWECTCWTNRDRKHLCTAHGENTDLVWAKDHVPSEVAQELRRIGKAA